MDGVCKEDWTEFRDDTTANKGIRGGVSHNSIVDWSRFSLAPYIRTVFPNEDWSILYADTLIIQELGYKYTFPRSKGYYLPDGLWVYGNGFICLEVGRCDLKDIPKGIQILHIGFDGQVNAVNIVDDVALEVVGAVKDAVEEFWLED